MTGGGGGERIDVKAVGLHCLEGLHVVEEKEDAVESHRVPLGREGWRMCELWSMGKRRRRGRARTTVQQQERVTTP